MGRMLHSLVNVSSQTYIPSFLYQIFFPVSLSTSHTALEAASSANSSTSANSHSSSNAIPELNNKLELLLSLDVALELIHADREALKRAETFAGYPGHYGHRVHDTIEEVFILLLQTLGENHVSPGFGQ